MYTIPSCHFFHIYIFCCLVVVCKMCMGTSCFLPVCHKKKLFIFLLLPIIIINITIILYPGPGCSKLTMSLVHVSLKFQTLREADCKHRALD